MRWLVVRRCAALVVRGCAVCGWSGRRRAGVVPVRCRSGWVAVREVVGMSEALLLPPHDAWTLADLDKVPDDGCRYEIFDGSLLVSPPPSVRHQAVAQVLSRLLEAAAGANVRVLQAAGIATSGQDDALKYVIPDVLVVSAQAVREDAQALDPLDVLAVIEIV